MTIHHTSGVEGIVIQNDPLGGANAEQLQILQNAILACLTME